MINLASEQDRKQFAQQIKSDIDQWCSDKYNDGHRDHLGASVMGEACSRKLWYMFRWAKLEIFSGRMQRLFQVGHNAEPRFKEYLEGIGFGVSLLNHTTKEQFRISAHNGHYGGSLDGMCSAPKRYEINEDLIFLNEFKTNGTGKGYTDVDLLGLAKAKPKHYGQMCQYGWHYKLKYGLYLIENKNDSDITVQIVELDWKLGQELQNKAGDIIAAQIPPAKVSLNDAYYECKFCTFSDICHHGAPVEINCRSCKYSSPVTNAEWFCIKHNGNIPKDFIKTGCGDHQSINGE